MGRVLVRPRPPMVVAAQPASIAWAARDATTEQVAIGQKATVTLTAKDATIDAAVAGLRASVALTAKDATIDAAVAGLRASVAMAARDAVGEGWSPALLPLTGWWRNYAGGNWTGTPSAGTSGSNDLIDTGDAPSVGAPLNGHGTADFDGSKVLFAEGTLATYADAEGFSGWAVIDAHELHTGVLFGALNPGGSGAGLSVALHVTGIVIVGLWDEALNATNAVGGPIEEGEPCIITWRYRPGAFGDMEIQVGVNGLPGSGGGGHSMTTSKSLPLSNPVMVGAGTSTAFNGRIAEIGLSDTELTDQNFTDVLSYIEQRYGLSL